MNVNTNFLNSNFINFAIGSSEKASTTADSNFFLDSLQSLSNEENNYDIMKEQYINGERDDIQNILIEGQKVNLKVSYLLELRNNAVNAVQQIMNISV